MAEYADGRKEAVSVTEPLVLEIEGRDTLDESLVLGDEVLIGQTVLEKLDVFVDCQRRRLEANAYHPDQAVRGGKYAVRKEESYESHSRLPVRPHDCAPTRRGA